MTTDLLIMTLNEIDGVKKIMPQIKKEWVDNILVVDGGSTDGTVEELEKMGFNVIRQKIKGYGGAILSGIEQTNCDNIVLFSPDGNHQPDEIRQLVEKIKEGYDQIVISRFGKNSVNLDAGLVDSFGNKMFTFLVNVFFGGNMTDPLTGCRIIKRKAMNEIKMNALEMDSTTQMSIRGLKLKQKIGSIEGNEGERIGGERKMKPLNVGGQISYQIIKEFIFW
jgi:glycosyltransferase involved in cell wall biosynthesis